MRVIASKFIPVGMVALLRGNQMVWYGKLADPWDDVDCDTAAVAKEDFTMLLARLRVQKEYRKEVTDTD